MATKKTLTVRADVTLSTWTTQDRKDFAGTLGKVAPGSSVYAASATLQASVANVVKCGADLAAAEDAVTLKLKEVTAAEAARNAVLNAYDKEVAVCTKVAEGACATVEELQELGFRARAPRGAPVPLVVPVSIAVSPGKERGWVFARVKRVAGITRYLAEVSGDPVAPESWKPLPGTGAIRRFGGLGIGGRCWIRFATARGVEQSAWSDAVVVVAR